MINSMLFLYLRIMTQTKTTGSYYCPMRCEGDKVYDAPGDCPVCGMHLVSDDAHAQNNVTGKPKLVALPSIKRKGESMGQYYCPMLCEGDKKYASPGNCPVCGMHL